MVFASVQGHFSNFNGWNRFSPEEQAAPTEAFAELEPELWQLARAANGDEAMCNIGGDSCADHSNFSMELIALNEADGTAVKAAAVENVLPIWRDACNAVDLECSATWKEMMAPPPG